ncbi:glycosyltransferase family 2 protein [Paenibacillus chitinolyticus]|uniref:glycosyltransferase family 2 protein n=1 Tax=Paenibacillus chitinolyticus TaxID=79263 RepID=UPI001C473AB4|nr:glycosyltransferase family 2 protein [Paenibacillus chitinolyticus]MBV6716003.1 glycosyltransferase family 2 protein [Paenibacillus chitinolyticus]
MSPTVTLSLVIPVYNEEKHLVNSVKKIMEVIVTLACDFEVILIDDGSKDNTWKEINDLSKMFKEVVGIQLSRNFGKEAALCAGLDYISGEVCIIMDADLQHPPDIIPEMMRLWKEGYDIVDAVKINRGHESFAYKLSSKLFYILLNKFTGYELTGASDYKLLDSKAIDAWRQMRERITFFRGMAAWLGYKRSSVPFVVAARVDGVSKWSVPALFKLAKNAITAFSTIPLQFITTIGLIFLLGSLLLGTNTLYQKISGEAISGFTTVIILLLIIGSILMIALGIIGEYLAKIYEEVKMRPRYLVRESVTYRSKENNLNKQDKEYNYVKV